MVLVFEFVLNTPPANHCLWRGGRVLFPCGTARLRLKKRCS